MEFTELYKCSGNLCSFSPNGAYLATAVDFRLVIRDAETLQILHLYTCIDAIGDLGWSRDSSTLFVASYKLAFVQVWSLKDLDWTAKLEEGLGGLRLVRWAPDGRHLLCFSDYHLRTTIWSLTTGEASFIQYPKAASEAGYAFRADGKYLAMAERHNGKDVVSIYTPENWALVKHFPVDTLDMGGLRWSPDGRFIAVWEALFEHKLLVYHPDGRLAGKHGPGDFHMGIKTVNWNPSGQLLVYGGYDQKVRLLNHYTWKPLLELSHPPLLESSEVAVFRETGLRGSNADSKTWDELVVDSKTQYECIFGNTPIPTVKPDLEKAAPKVGVGLIEFDSSGRLLVTKNDNMPHALWVWDLVALRQIALIINMTAIKTVRWNPVRPRQLAFSSGTGSMYLWNSGTLSPPSKFGHERGPGEALNAQVHGGTTEVIEIPSANFNVQSFEWNPKGDSLVLMDKDKFCLAFPV